MQMDRGVSILSELARLLCICLHIFLLSRHVIEPTLERSAYRALCVCGLHDHAFLHTSQECLFFRTTLQLDVSYVVYPCTHY